MKTVLMVHLALLLWVAGVPAAAAVWLGEYPAGTMTVVAPVTPEPSALELELAPPRPEPLSAPLPPVPEPLLVVMLACGLLLMMPRTWLADWSRLGDPKTRDRPWF
ncbi:hypothetical protein [Massilia sp. YMA4]|uniref:hypothetical protein n=1 Tax=Massilia sp. YMA4 TaxID=1593482 RepID=UPI000DD15B38|nr:hypothetical protein [Massilia sp. YMA4]AXA93018.1 hypothetical protein DPH57_18800 [Massilia sp. YMA4]